jgi:hypothetical protein
MHCANTTTATTTIADQLQFLHAPCFSPSTSTWIIAIKGGHFTSWPGVTAANVRRHLPKSMATALGHLDQQRQNLRSTKTLPDTEMEDSNNPTQAITNGQCTNYTYAAVVDYHIAKGQIYSDLTGRLPVQSSRGNKYVFVV